MSRFVAVVWLAFVWGIIFAASPNVIWFAMFTAIYLSAILATAHLERTMRG